jgi:WD40 repeat protein
MVSVGSDKVGVVYTGVSATVVGKLDTAGGHTGGIYHAAWSPDSKRLVTVGGDKTVRMWDMSGEGPVFACTAHFTVGTRPEDMQQSVAWPKADVIISTSLEGTLNYFNPEDVAAGPTKKVFGHHSPMQLLTVDRASGKLYTGCSGGRVCVWSPADEARTVFSAAVTTGDVPTKRISGVSVAGGVMAAVAWDDKLRVGDATTGAFTGAVACGAQPKGVAVVPTAPELKVVVTGSAILVVKGTAVASTTAAAYGPTCVDVSQDGTTVAVGGNDKKVHIYSLESGAGTIKEAGETKEAPAAISVVAISPNGEMVAAGDSGREVRLYTMATREALISSRWMNHTTRVTGLAWSPSGRVIASVSTDRRLCIWDPKQDQAVMSVDLAHPQPFATCAWAGENDLWTLGTDGVATLRKINV